MKVKAIQFVPLGRKPREGEWYCFGELREAQLFNYWGVDAPVRSSTDAQAVERVEVEVERPDAVPGWIENLGGPDVPYDLLRAFAVSFRAHVEERAKSAADRLTKFIPGDDAKTEIIREEFLR